MLDSHTFARSLKNNVTQTLEHYTEELRKIRGGKVLPSIVEGFSVAAYGGTIHLKDIATITSRDPHTLTIEPWDKNLIKAILAAIQASALSVNPVTDGKTVLLPFPPMSEENRKELVKLIHMKQEEAKIALRRQRDGAMKELTASERAKEISEDMTRRLKDEVEKTVKDATDELATHTSEKAAEIMTI
ncbi:MAG: ribosome recycling factor [Parcubacteria group bacterium]|nr:ribosome recycling factor [Parcubacteria group bacterium]